MIPSEVFSLELDLYLRTWYRDAVSKYWEIEMEIAGEHGIEYCDLEQCDIESRTCAVCFTINDVDSPGYFLPQICANNDCQEIRKYWGITASVSEFSYIRCEKTRAAWLRNRIKKVFHTGSSLSHINEDLRFDFLLNAMIERIAIEANRKDH